MTYDPLSLCTDKGDHFEVDPAVMFPATIERLQEVLAGAPPVEIKSPDWNGVIWRDIVVNRFLEQAEKITNWKSGKALELAESYFKRALALKVGHGLRIRIIKNEEYRR